MKKNRIRLTESQLQRVIKESVQHVLNENQGFMDGVRGAWNGFKGGFGNGAAMQGIKRGYQQGAQEQQQTLAQVGQNRTQNVASTLGTLVQELQQALSQNNYSRAESCLQSIEMQSQSALESLTAQAGQGFNYNGYQG